MQYRAEIDGLRAVAIIPVILFHAGFDHFSGGFIGVDVFFVISGYLITTIILSEKEKGTFSLVHFYERRARRILPALFLVMTVCIPFAWLWLTPSDLKDFSQSLFAVSIFSSNILFWLETGYWGVANELKPLLHTWSLAVEEQFYIFFPLFLMLMWRSRKRWILTSLIVISTISLFVAQWGAYNIPTANFFLLTSRAWELALGACIAFYFLYRKQTVSNLLSHKIIKEILGLTGLLMIGYSIYVFDETVPFPGFYALAPTIGAGMIVLFSSRETLVGRLLGTKLLVGVGLISYSAYLWHQPLFAFARHRSMTEPSELLYATLTLATLLLAYLSWNYVEKPFRKKEKFSRKQIFLLAAAGSVVFMTFGLTGHITGGFADRTTKNAITFQSIDEKLKINQGMSKTCDGPFTLSDDCNTSDEPELLVWGDSYAMHLIQGILASKPDAKIIQMTRSRCGPFFDISYISLDFPVSRAESCLKFTEKVRGWIKTNNTIKYVIVSSPFNDYLAKENSLLLRNGDLVPTNIELITQEFIRTLRELETMGVTPIVFSPPPRNGLDLGRCLARAEWIGMNLDVCNFQVDDISQEYASVYRLLDNLEKNYRVIRLENLICDDMQCKVHLGSAFIYRDTGHLSHEGSAALGEKFDFYKMIVDGYLN